MSMILAIDPTHIYALATLPPHHKDPFDRLLIAQAEAERLALVTADSTFATYGATTLW
jgi:PIN domain nuclease of toxin-antitoxin system